MKKVLFVGAVIVGLLLCLVLAKPRAVLSGAAAAQSTADAPDHVASSRPMRRMPIKLPPPTMTPFTPVGVPTLPSEPPPPSNLPPVIEWAGPWPTRLKDIPVTPRVQESLDRWSPFDEELIDRRLDMLPKITSCLNGRVKSVGNVELTFHYAISDIDKKTDVGVGTGDGVDVTASTLDEGDDAVVLECVKKVHEEGTVRVPGAGIIAEEDGHFHWPTYIHIPTKNDWIYPSLLKK